MKMEKDIEIPLRDGARLRADVFRPRSASRVPVIMNLGIYQKDKTWTPPDDLEEKANPQMVWETANPPWWVPRGYALVRVDARGWPSPGAGGASDRHPDSVARPASTMPRSGFSRGRCSRWPFALKRRACFPKSAREAAATPWQQTNGLQSPCPRANAGDA
jgi:hypothetical protein